MEWPQADLFSRGRGLGTKAQRLAPVPVFMERSTLACALQPAVKGVIAVVQLSCVLTMSTAACGGAVVHCGTSS